MGTHGASKKANTPWPVTNCRILSRSLNERPGPPSAMRARCAICASKLALNTRLLRRSSSRTLTPTSTRERVHSAKNNSKNSASVMTDMASSVVAFWLTMTRSKSCIMYMVGVSMSTLAIALKMPTMKNSRRKAQRVSESSFPGAPLGSRRTRVSASITLGGRKEPWPLLPKERGPPRP